VLRLPSGNHTVEITSAEGDGVAMVTVSCLDGSGRPHGLGSRKGDGSLTFAVPGSGCPAQELSLMVDEGARDGLRIALKSGVLAD